MSLYFRPGSVYYNKHKKFHLLVTERKCGLIVGYTSRYGNPSTEDCQKGLTRELVGAMDFGDFKIAFGNRFTESIVSLIPEERNNLDEHEREYEFVRNLQKREYQIFRLIKALCMKNKIIVSEKSPDMPIDDDVDLDVYEHNPYRIKSDKLYINT